ncbi:hypothetical protein BJ508DRAFT_323021 [Ascobolus immersus RN42]|uniref:Uncharacterized protein n=1 Tax=Ascobolus immersus RN42 TaxID=1160509 RepID=A0A3N4IHT8_ASCIM|nr:hypothetical protein BJ508DRAFT_323021 [Ascobolus immersus RN42]
MALSTEFGWPERHLGFPLQPLPYHRRCYRRTHAIVRSWMEDDEEPEKKTILVGNSSDWGGQHIYWLERENLFEPDDADDGLHDSGLLQELYASEEFQQSLDDA